MMQDANQKIIDTGCYSLVKGRMAKGCEYCVRGEKLVLFVTGLCGLKCFYCPVSDKKINKDVIYANEWKIEKPEDIIEEAKLTEAKGVGITGGDPLVVVDRVCEYLRILKKEFGKEFHAHLYTTFRLVTEERLKKLYDAGLDEIRFHANLYDKTLWPRIELARKYDWDIGIEIPCIPKLKQEILDLINYVKGKVDFLNLNELEWSERNDCEYTGRGFVLKNPLSYAVKGSAELGRELLKEAKNEGLTLYFCTSKLKDSIQLRNRIKRRAKNIKKSFDEITDEGTIIRGAIYLPELAPGFNYREKLAQADKTRILTDLNNLMNALIKEFNISEDMIFVDDVKLRLVTDKKILKEHSAQLKKQNLIPAVVEEYPTRDATEMEVDFI